MTNFESRAVVNDASTRPQFGYARGSRFADVWSLLTSDSYTELPIKRLRWRDVLRFLPTRLLHDSERTLNDERDVLPSFEKLVHPVGIAMRGVWTITESTRYTGYFTQGSEALIIARASDATGEYRPGKLRFMGIAGKLYPTRDEQHRMPLRTANFFTVENISGSHSAYFAHAKYNSNLFPSLPHPGAALKGPIGAAAVSAFMLAERTLDPTQGAIRQLYPIAELGHTGPSRAPAFMRLVGDESNPRIASSDLRLEIAEALRDDAELRFWIEVADGPSRYLPKDWARIGHIVFTEAAASVSADHRLHFPHPKFRR